ncbi:hypothetical protein CAOG_08922 [Capsaspora owczarzaki ATCC 30864]|uniref:hypothetical protein n=1 Tax=Capsaspora owczarzaki (strain ATCC 30864) TaxID=595528 RepID=UPI0003520AC4|nr:hypothetical protein CAOG_08922 [Capsaspora owczarzaki ATCC 30864]|eukprot:XP_011270593.1 hypothetical protein CAOG_08922 [Capsaspora owczarzaki ATCC 30864]
MHSHKMRVFQLSQFDNAQAKLQQQILSLGDAECLIQSAFDPRCTHVIANQPSRSVKLLGCCSKAPKHLESVALITHDFDLTSLDKADRELYGSARRWRIARQSTRAGPFDKWIALIPEDACSVKRDFQQVLKIGGATILPLVAANISKVADGTRQFALIDAQQEPSAILTRLCAQQRLQLASTSYPADFLVKKSAPPIEQYVVKTESGGRAQRPNPVTASPLPSPAALRRGMQATAASPLSPRQSRNVAMATSSIVPVEATSPAILDRVDEPHTHHAGIASFLRATYDAIPDPTTLGELLLALATEDNRPPLACVRALFCNLFWNSLEHLFFPTLAPEAIRSSAAKEVNAPSSYNPPAGQTWAVLPLRTAIQRFPSIAQGVLQSLFMSEDDRTKADEMDDKLNKHRSIGDKSQIDRLSHEMQETRQRILSSDRTRERLWQSLLGLMWLAFDLPADSPYAKQLNLPAIPTQSLSTETRERAGAALELLCDMLIVDLDLADSAPSPRSTLSFLRALVHGDSGKTILSELATLARAVAERPGNDSKWSLSVRAASDQYRRLLSSVPIMLKYAAEKFSISYMNIPLQVDANSRLQALPPRGTFHAMLDESLRTAVAENVLIAQCTPSSSLKPDYQRLLLTPLSIEKLVDFYCKLEPRLDEPGPAHTPDLFQETPESDLPRKAVRMTRAQSSNPASNKPKIAMFVEDLPSGSSSTLRVASNRTLRVLKPIDNLQQAQNPSKPVNKKEKPNRAGETRLMRACKAPSRFTLEHIRQLLDEGADPNARDNAQWTPLHEATRYGTTDVCRLLIERDADVTAAGDGGVTALHYASHYHGNLELVALLLQHGADPRAKDADGESCIDWCQHKLDAALSTDETNKWAAVLAELQNPRPVLAHVAGACAPRPLQLSTVVLSSSEETKPQRPSAAPQVKRSFSKSNQREGTDHGTTANSAKFSHLQAQADDYVALLMYLTLQLCSRQLNESGALLTSRVAELEVPLSQACGGQLGDRARLQFLILKRLNAELSSA